MAEIKFFFTEDGRKQKRLRKKGKKKSLSFSFCHLKKGGKRLQSKVEKDKMKETIFPFTSEHLKKGRRWGREG